MNINEMKIKDVSEETLRNYLKRLDKKPALTLSDDLKVTQYRNGDPIPLAISNEQWMEFGDKGIGAYCVNEKGDYLYNWYTVNNTRGLAPEEGWHIPTDEEWKKLKEQLQYNSSYAGYRTSGGSYHGMGYYGYFWSSTELNSHNAWGRTLNYGNSEVSRGYYSKKYGFSVRCVKEK